MQQIILLFHMLLAFAIIALVLLQQGKGATMGAGFGGGASNTLFGSRGPASFLMKLTGFFMFLFFVSSLSLGYWASYRSKHNQDVLLAPVKTTQIAPATTPAPAKKSVAIKRKSEQAIPQKTQKS